MVELKGSLGSLGLPAIVQLIGDLHHSGNLELNRGETRAVLGFDDGRLVAARYGQQRGFKALAASTVELADADFLFVEGAPSDERTMDLGGSELQKQIRQLLNGEVTAEVLESAPPKVDDALGLGICPLLGFVDDPTRHYSRPTAMHRCFSGGVASLVTSRDQRDLCLSGRYPTCPRYRNGSVGDSVSEPSATAAAAVAAVSSPPDAVAPAPGIHSPPGVPAGVAARLAANSQIRMAPSDTADGVPDWIGGNHSGPSVDAAPAEARASRFDLRHRRGIVLVGIGAVLGLLVLVAAVFLARPVLNGALAQKPSTTVAPIVEPAPTLARVVASVSAATSVPTLAPTATLASRPATPTARLAQTLPAPTLPVPGQPLTDVRFAAGPKPGWLDNPPFAMWSDGAYRLQARQQTHFVAVGVPLDTPLADLVASATFRKTGGPPGGGYGLIVRDQSPNPLDGVNQDASFYVMEAGDLGDIGVWRRDRDHWIDLVPWEHSDSVRVGGSPNDLVARAVGDRLTFTVNQTEVASVQDNTLATGGVGVFVGGDYNEVALDRFVVQVPD